MIEKLQKCWNALQRSFIVFTVPKSFATTILVSFQYFSVCVCSHDRHFSRPKKTNTNQLEYLHRAFADAFDWKSC